MAEEKKGFHYAWLILIGCACFSAGGIALTLNIAGVYLLPLGEAMRLGPGEAALWLAVTGPSSVVASPIWGNLVQTKNFNVVSSIAAFIMIIGLLIFAFATQIWHLFAGGICLGVAMPCIFGLSVPILIGNWFDESIRGRMLGIAMAFTGLGTFIWAPLFATLIQNVGVQTTYIINAVVCAVLLLPFSLFIFKFKPEDKGLKPYGYKPGAEAKNDVSAMAKGTKVTTALKSLAFWALLLTVGFTTFGMGFNASQPKLAAEFLSGVMDPAAVAIFGASMISVAAAGNIIGKLIFGFLTDKLGLRPTMIFYYVLFAGAFVVWLFIHTPVGMMVGAFLFGTHNALVSVGYPLLARSVFGSKNFSKIFSYISMVGQFIGGFGASTIGYIYQFFGSYSYALYLGIGLVCFVSVMAMIAISRIGKVAQDDRDKTLVADTE